MKRYLVVYQGVVQGVGFRGKLMYLARINNLTGYCKNLSNGDVQVEIQGYKLDEFIKESIKNDGFVQVFDYSIKQLPLIEDEDKFQVRF